MDRLDIKILGRLYRGVSSHGFQPEVKGVYSRIAKGLGLDEDTIRKRVDRLESTGVITNWMLVINPNAIGMKIYAIWMTVSPQLKIEDAVRKIRLVRGVISIAREVGDILGIGLLCETEQAFRKSAELISELAGRPEITTYAVDHPVTPFELSATDWDIISALRPDPLIRYTEVAERLGLSPKTVQRRMTKLTEGNVIFFVPEINFSELEGATCVDLFITYTSSGLKATVDRNIYTKFEEYVLRAGWGSPSHGHFEFIVPNLMVAQQIVDWARSLQGVREVKINFVFEWSVFYDDVMDEILAAQRRPS